MCTDLVWTEIIYVKGGVCRQILRIGVLIVLFELRKHGLSSLQRVLCSCKYALFQKGFGSFVWT